MFASRFDAFFTVPSGSSVAATNSGGTATAVSLTAGNYTIATFCTHLQARLNAVRTPAAWTVTPNYTSSVILIPGTCLLNCAGETWALTFTTAAVGTLLGFVGNIASRATEATGSQNFRGLYMPDCPLDLEGDPVRAPIVTDTRSTESPTGAVYSIGGTSKYRHRGLRFSHVTRARTFEGSSTPTYSSLEQWLKDTQWSAGHTWFSRGSKFQIYWDNGGTATIVGADLNSGSGPTNGWAFSPAVDSIDGVVKKASGSWLGMWSVDFPPIVSEG
jgi:hypothetical protein